MKFFFALVLCVCCALQGGPARAADAASLETQVQELGRLVKDLSLTVEHQQREIALLKGQTPPAFTTPGPQSGPLAGRPAPSAGRWNPDIGVIGDVVFTSDSAKEDEEGADRISVRELEVVFGAAVDPWTRFDATLGIADFEEMSIEEAYATRFGLPLGSTARFGRVLPKIGKAIPVHRDTLDTVDEPLVVARYFGHHGFSKSGADWTVPLDLPTGGAHEATLGVLEGGNGEEGTLFGESRREPTVYSHLKNYWDFSDVSGIELGASHLAGSRDDDSSFEVNVIGVDGTFRHRFAADRGFKLQSELFWVDRSESFYESEDEFGNLIYEDLDGSTWGAYLLADLRFHTRWSTGVRLDAVDLIALEPGSPDSRDEGVTGYLTFHQSEFARWRVQLSHFDLADGEDDNQVLVQGTFAIGEHKHKLV